MDLPIIPYYVLNMIIFMSRCFHFIVWNCHCWYWFLVFKSNKLATKILIVIQVFCIILQWIFWVMKFFAKTENQVIGYKTTWCVIYLSLNLVIGYSRCEIESSNAIPSRINSLLFFWYKLLQFQKKPVQVFPNCIDNYGWLIYCRMTPVFSHLLCIAFKCNVLLTQLKFN